MRHKHAAEQRVLHAVVCTSPSCSPKFPEQDSAAIRCLDLGVNSRKKGEPNALRLKKRLHPVQSADLQSPKPGGRTRTFGGILPGAQPLCSDPSRGHCMSFCDRHMACLESAQLYIYICDRYFFCGTAGSRRTFHAF